MTTGLFLLLAAILSDIIICILASKNVKSVNILEKIAYLNLFMGILGSILLLIDIGVIGSTTDFDSVSSSSNLGGDNKNFLSDEKYED